jgi:hypothetical protein
MTISASLGRSSVVRRLSLGSDSDVQNDCTGVETGVRSVAMLRYWFYAVLTDSLLNSYDTSSQGDILFTLPSGMLLESCGTVLLRQRYSSTAVRTYAPDEARRRPRRKPRAHLPRFLSVSCVCNLLRFFLAAYVDPYRQEWDVVDSGHALPKCRSTRGFARLF